MDGKTLFTSFVPSGIGKKREVTWSCKLEAFEGKGKTGDRNDRDEDLGGICRDRWRIGATRAYRYSARCGANVSKSIKANKKLIYIRTD
jgi:hypothetical protein